MEYLHRYTSPLGGITASSDGINLTGLWFDGQKYAATPESNHIEKNLPVFAQTGRWLAHYFDGQEPQFTPPICPRGTEFRKAVWKIVLAISYGQTMSYGEIADLLAKKNNLSRMSARAIGGAVAHNPIALIIPCHRVIGARGSLKGYAGGVDKKIKLLEMENQITHCIL